MKKKHIIIIILGSIFILLSIFHSNIWFDEAYSVGIANQSFIDIWKIGGHDVHPVLYYWMLRCICVLTNGSIIAYRVFSAVAVIILGILGYTHIRKDFGEKTGFLFSFFTYFLPMMAVYANQIRMYSWAILIVTVLAIYAYRIYKGDNCKKNWIIFVLTSLSSIYIHYYGLMAAGIINLFLFIYFIKNKKVKELKLLILFGVMQLLAYIPWIVSLMGQMEHVSKGFWIGFEFPKTLFELIGCQMNGTLNSTSILSIGFSINLLLFIYLTISVLKNRKTQNFKIPLISALIYFSVIMAALIITVILKNSVLYYRYLFVITGLYIFSISDILAKANNRVIVRIILVITIILGVFNNIVQIQQNYAKENGKEIEYLKENIQEGDVLVYSNIGNGSIIASNFLNNKQYFYNKEDWGVKEAYKVWAPQMETWITTEFLDYCKGRIWIIDSESNDFFKELFDNEKYTYVSTERFDTKYQNYVFNINLVTCK